jgi:hypothetical protein
MSAGWVAGTVRARLLLRRRLGRERAVDVAACHSLRDGLALLAGSGYGPEVHAQQDLAEAQRAVAATLLLHLRVLAAWLPPSGAASLRALAAWFELVNIQDRLAYLLGDRLPKPFELGGLSTAWSRLSQAQSPSELRRALASSAWGDPGDESSERVHLALRLAWADRVLGAAPELSEVVSGGLALLTARELFAAGRPLELLATRPVPALDSTWQTARTFPELVERLPDRASWALAQVDRIDELWLAELAWWSRAQDVGRALLRSGGGRQAPVLGAVLLLAVDAWRTSAALEVAAANGPAELQEALNETA